MYLHESRYRKIKFLKDKTKSFITWICPLLKPFPYSANQFVYHEGDDVDHIFFLTLGKCCFVMPSFDNTSYIQIAVGDNFGIVDIVGSSAQKEFELNKFIENINLLSRQFTVMATSDSELLSFNIQDLNRMRLEFSDCYENLFNDALIKLKRTWLTRLRAMKECRAQLREFNRTEKLKA